MNEKLEKFKEKLAQAWLKVGKILLWALLAALCGGRASAPSARPISPAKSAKSDRDQRKTAVSCGRRLFFVLSSAPAGLAPRALFIRREATPRFFIFHLSFFIFLSLRSRGSCYTVPDYHTRRRVPCS